MKSRVAKQNSTNQIQLKTAIGVIAIRWNPKGFLTRIRVLPIGNSKKEPINLQSLDDLPLYVGKLLEGLKRYFEYGEPLSEIQWQWIDTKGWTLFQNDVYRAAALVPHGETRPYAWIARRLNNPQACRAVGQALRKNPLPILIPCHRIISSQGHLGGFMGQEDPNHFKTGIKTQFQTGIKKFN